MKLSKETIAILKNFSTINSGIQFVEGNEIRVASIDKTVMGIATVQEDFPVDFAIYDLTQFLAVLSLFTEPDLEFKDDYLLIKEGRNRVKYFYIDPRNIVAAPYEFNPDIGEASLFVSAEQLGKLNKASSIMKLGDFAIVKEGESIQMIVEDAERDVDNTNNYTIDLEFEVEMDDFNVQLKMKTLNFMPLDYEIDIINEDLLMFNSPAQNIKYFVAVVN